MKKAMYFALVSTVGIISIVLFLLWMIGDARFVPALGNPRLWVSAGILFLAMSGLFSVFRMSFLRKYLGLSFILPLIWFATFTWAYGYLYLPENKFLGDYYGMIALLFTLPYIFYAWKWEFQLFSPILSFFEGERKGKESCLKEDKARKETNWQTEKIKTRKQPVSAI